MCSQELDIQDGIINACSFIYHSDKDQIRLCIYDSLHQLRIYESSTSKPLDFQLISILQPSNEELKSYELGNLFWHNDEQLIASTTTGCNASTVVLINVNDESSSYDIESSTIVMGVVKSMCNGDVELSQFLVQTTEGKTSQIAISADNSLKLQKQLYHMPTSADEMMWYAAADLEYFALICLRQNQCLYINGQRVAENVTSFCLAGKYLAYTQLQSLNFIKLTQNASQRRLISERKIERGGKLISIINRDARTILQMPRGNLEAIYPRVLALDIVGSLLDHQKYFETFDLLRKQRINLNIICDHNLNAFLKHMDIFLQQIVNPNWLNLFLSDLLNEDLTLSMYASNYDGRIPQYPEGFKISHKVSFICEKLCERMLQQSDQKRYHLPIITSHVKMGNLEKALQLIWEQKKNISQQEDAESSLKYLLYLVDVNQLYNVALGTYDFGLVLFVAQKSQKDPKEFLPFLNELKALEINYRKFKIDEHLKRYEKALENIAACGAEKFEESLNFIRSHVLYRQALKFYASQSECYAKICLAFGDYLRANGKLENASFMYERGGNLNQALMSAKHVLDWQRVLCLAKKDSNLNVVEVAW